MTRFPPLPTHYRDAPFGAPPIPPEGSEISVFGQRQLVGRFPVAALEEYGLEDLLRGSSDYNASIQSLVQELQKTIKDDIIGEFVKPAESIITDFDESRIDERVKRAQLLLINLLHQLNRVRRENVSIL